MSRSRSRKALADAVELGRSEVEALLFSGATAQDLDQALITAVKMEDVPAIKLLIRAGARIQKRGAMSMLDVAINHGCEASLDVLIECGAQLDWYSLPQAIYRGNVRMVRALLRHGADPNALDGHPLAPVHMVTEGVQPGHPPLLEIAQALLRAGGDPFLADENGQFPGHPVFAAEREQQQLIGQATSVRQAHLSRGAAKPAMRLV
jgi:hypothetical protein